MKYLLGEGKKIIVDDVIYCIGDIHIDLREKSIKVRLDTYNSEEDAKNNNARTHNRYYRLSGETVIDTIINDVLTHEEAILQEFKGGNTSGEKNKDFSKMLIKNTVKEKIL